MALKAAAITVDRVHLAWNADIIMTVLLIYIKTAFQSVARGRQILAIKAMQIDGVLIR